MYQRGETKVFNPFAWLVAGDILAIACSFFIATAAQPSGIVPSQFGYVLYGLLLLFVARKMKLYTWGAFTLLTHLLARLIATLLISAFCFAVLNYILFREHFSYKIVDLAYELGRQMNRWFSHPLTNDPGLLRGWIRLQLASSLALFLIIRRSIFWAATKFVSRLQIERVAFIGWSANLDMLLKGITK